jgi:hypothetical protein
VIALDSWRRTAKSLDATKLTTANIKKVARKLKVDAVIEAAATERRSGVKVRIRLRSGRTGRTVEEVDAVAKDGTFDKASQRDIRDEIVDVISALDDEDEDEPAPKKRRAR